MAQTSEIHYPRPLLVVNPKYAHVGNQVLAELQQSGRKADVFQSQPDPTHMANLLLAHTHSAQAEIDEMAVCVVGGDGTGANVLKGLLHARSKVSELTKLPILFMAGGFASDSRAATQAKGCRRPSEKLQRSHIAPAHWIERQLTLPGGHAQEDIAMLYAGFGKTAYGSGLANTAERRLTGKLGKKLSVGIGTLCSTNYVEFLKDGETAAQRVADLTFCLNSIMSGQFYMRADLRGDKAEAAETPEGFWPGLSFVAGLSRPNSLGRLTSALNFQLVEPTLAHLDGEPPELLSANTSVDLRVSPQTYPLLISR